MAYDKKSFLAGIAVGRQMKGWSASPIYLGGGDNMNTVILTKANEYQPTAVEKQMFGSSIVKKTPVRVFLELNEGTRLYAEIPAAFSTSAVTPGNGWYYFSGIVQGNREDWFVVLQITVSGMSNTSVQMFAFNTSNTGSSYSTPTAIKTRSFAINLFGYCNYVKQRLFYTSSLGSGSNRQYQIKTRYLNSDGSLDTTYEYRAPYGDSDLTVTFTRQ